MKANAGEVYTVYNQYLKRYTACQVAYIAPPDTVSEQPWACLLYTSYGQSFEALTTGHILSLVSQLRPDMVKELKTSGSGKLPPNIQKWKTKHLTASANDAFAAIRITAKDVYKRQPMERWWESF